MSSSRARMAGAVLAVLVGLAGCGGDSADQRPLAEQSIADQAEALRGELLSPEEIGRTPAGSAERAFLEYWSAVQHADVRGALLAYDPALVDIVGAPLMSAAIRNAMPLYRAAPPSVERKRAKDGTTTLRYFATTQVAGGMLAPLSVALRRIGGSWRIVFHSALDDELRIAAQQETQGSIDPAADRPGAQAVAAGDTAARLQAIYLERNELGPAGERRR